MKKSAQLKCLTICSLICRSAAERRRLKAAVGNRFGGGSMKDHENKKGRLDSVINSFWQVHGQTSLTASHDITSFVGQRRDVMRWPPACESVVVQVAGGSVGRNPWSRGGHTQVAGSGAFSKTGGRRGGCVLFGHKASLARLQQLQRWRVEMCIFEWCEVWIGGLTEPSAGSRR